MKYRILGPVKCFRCGASCYSPIWSTKNDAKGKAEVFWRCCRCGRSFISSEKLEEIMVEVNELPATPYHIGYEEVKENIANKIDA